MAKRSKRRPGDPAPKRGRRAEPLDEEMDILEPVAAGLDDPNDMDPDDEAEGEFLDMEEDPESDVEETDDGAYVKVDDSPKAGESEHFANLAETLPTLDLTTLAGNLLDLIDHDKESRSKRDEQYEEGLRRTGLGDDAPGGASFTGASKVVHPVLAKAAVDFSARAMKELFPPGGPAKDYIPGTPTKEKVEKARRKTKHLNYQLAIQCKDFRPDLEQVLTQIPLGGVQYLNVDWDMKRKRPCFNPIYVDQMLLPYAASNYYTAERRTYMEDITQEEFDARVRSGLYLDVAMGAAGQEPEQTAAGKANDKIEGRSSSAYNEDGVRRVYKVELQSSDVEEDDDFAPYIVHIDDWSRNVLGVYRNWLEDDDNREELNNTIEFPFIPWRGAYPIGLTHLIGSLAGTATGAMRALLDAAQIENFPGALKLKSAVGGQSTQINATQLTEIDGGIVQDDIRKLVMPLPFNGPSAVLFSLLGFAVEAAESVVQTSFEKLSDGRTDLPVGTTMALIDQGLTVFSSIHARLHASMQRLLEVVHRLNALYLDEEVLKDDVGEILAHRRDYEGPIDVVPVSDPNISSEVQRLAKVQAIVQRADAKPELYNPMEVEKRFLEQIKVPDYERLLVKEADLKPKNAINENMAAIGGQPLAAFPEQDHLAHMQVHLDYILKIAIPMMSVMGPQVLGTLLDHLKQHVGFWYVRSVYQVLEEATGIEPEKLMGDDPEVSRELDKLLAAASTRVLDSAGATFGQVPQIVQQAQQLLQSLMPPPPMDPTQAATQAAQAETHRRAKADADKAATEQAKIAQQTQDDEATRQQDDADRIAELGREQLRQTEENKRTAAELASREEMNEEDNTTALTLASMEMATGEKTALSTGTGINP